jgi:hypothetical protein
LPTTLSSTSTDHSPPIERAYVARSRERAPSIPQLTIRRGRFRIHAAPQLDQIVVSRGLARGPGLKLNANSVAIFREAVVATPSGRPRPFNWTSKKGTSNHLPLKAMLEY